METDPQRPYRRAIDNCHKIGFLCRALAEAAGRRFMAPVNDEDFECEAAASGFAGDLEYVLMFVERAAAAAEDTGPVHTQVSNAQPATASKRKALQAG
jgi:hypothetical protein